MIFGRSDRLPLALTGVMFVVMGLLLTGNLRSACSGLLCIAFGALLLGLSNGLGRGKRGE